MRIISGHWRGRAIVAPPGDATRPTADRVREALFSMLLSRLGSFEGLRVFDGFAGTGALGLEALSRGAAKAWFIEQDRLALAALRANVLSVAAANATVLAGDATRPPRAPIPCDLVFLDPPYGRGLGPRAVAALDEAGWIAADTVIVLELGRDEELPELGALLADRTHGAARITVWGPRLLRSD